MASQRPPVYVRDGFLHYMMNNQDERESEGAETDDADFDFTKDD
jgi:hypothetical protein